VFGSYGCEVRLRSRLLRSLFGMVLAVVAVGYASAQQSVRIAPADILIVHAKIYTLDSQKPWAQAVAIRKGKIIAIGREEEVERFRGIGTKRIDAGGKLVLPGFTDCHVHFLDGSLALGRVQLEGAKDVAEIQTRLKEYATQRPGTDWLLGGGWNYAMFGDVTLPDKKYLDQLFPDRPVFLEGFDLHTFWVNSKALELAGITRNTPDPPNGIIVRDAQTGEATGALKEDADAVIKKVIPPPSRVEQLTALRAGIKSANQDGITRVHSAGWDFEILPLLAELRQENQLTLRFHMAYRLNGYQLSQKDIDAIEAARKTFHDEWLNVNSVKFVLDGVVESHTAALLEPYADIPTTQGALFWDPQKFKDAVAELDKRGLQLYTHAVGDYAVRTALDAYEFAENKNHSKDRRNRVEHIETIAATDIPRFGKLGVIASMQPLHSYPDADTLEVWAKALGPDRASRGWVWKSIAGAGGHYAFGSDWPIVTINPWEGIQTAVTRQTDEGTPVGGFLPSQRLTVEEAVAGYTRNAAYAGHLEKSEGSLEVGKVADLILIDRNIFEIDPHHIGETKVLTTIVGGKIVYEADSK
jgi:predicted amidohydrolase YtcJ